MPYYTQPLSRCKYRYLIQLLKILLRLFHRNTIKLCEGIFLELKVFQHNNQLISYISRMTATIGGRSGSPLGERITRMKTRFRKLLGRIFRLGNYQVINLSKERPKNKVGTGTRAVKTRGKSLPFIGLGIGPITTPRPVSSRRSV